MTNLFANYEQSLELKELGFDEPCLAFFHEKCEDNDKVGISGKFQSLCGWSKGRENTDDLSSHDFIVIAPLKQQVFEWFRDNYNLNCWIENYYKERYYPKIDEMVHPKTIDRDMLLLLKEFKTYEEAENAAINKLIEIVKIKYSW
jgi:hypothetical protein